MYRIVNNLLNLILLCYGFGTFGHCATVYSPKNNVCRNLDDYNTIDSNKNCYYNPDFNSPLWMIAKRYGYYLVKYDVVTEDGYYLTLHRLLYNYTDNFNTRPPILLQHGIMVTSGIWMMIGKNSPAFYLLNEGYDVWMANSRGSVLSEKHTKYSRESAEYWNFSFHEMGLYDIPAFIDLIRSKSKSSEKVILLGHSMGTSISYIYASIRRDHADKHLKAIISVAPIAYMRNFRTFVKPIALFTYQIDHFARVTGVEVLLRGSKLIQTITRTTCTSPKMVPTCERLIELLNGYNPEQMAAEYVPVFFRIFFEPITLKTIVHFGQIIKNNGTFQQYDYGIENNRNLYGSEMPPEYEVGKIAQPVHLFIGRNDLLADVLDAKTLYGKLTSKKSFHVVNDNGVRDFAHNDFVMGKYVRIFYKQLKSVLDSKNLFCC